MLAKVHHRTIITDCTRFTKPHYIIVKKTDRSTYHATRSVTKGRIYVRSTAMRPNNKIM